MKKCGETDASQETGVKMGYEDSRKRRIRRFERVRELGGKRAPDNP